MGKLIWEEKSDEKVAPSISFICTEKVSAKDSLSKSCPIPNCDLPTAKIHWYSPGSFPQPVTSSSKPTPSNLELFGRQWARSRSRSASRTWSRCRLVPKQSFSGYESREQARSAI